MRKLVSFGTLGVLFLLNQAVFAQKYISAFGVRVGKSDFGLTLQQKVWDRVTVEGIGTVGEREVRATGLLERHYPLLGKPFNYYLGAGGHVGHLKEKGAFYGLDVIAGLELKVPIAPIVASIDVKPAIHANHDNWLSLGGGVSLRYILVKEKKKKLNLGNIFRGKQEEEPKRVWPFGKKKEEPPKRKFNPFGKKPEPEPVKKRFSPFKKKEPEPLPEPPKRLRLFERPAPPPPPPAPEPEKKRFRLFEKQPAEQPAPPPPPEPEPGKRRIRWSE